MVDLELQLEIAQEPFWQCKVGKKSFFLCFMYKSLAILDNIELAQELRWCHIIVGHPEYWAIYSLFQGIQRLLF